MTNTTNSPLSATGEDADATARLPALDHDATTDDAVDVGSATDVVPAPVIPVSASDLADRLREVEQQLDRSEARVRELEAVVVEAADRVTGLEARLGEAGDREAALQEQLRNALTQIQSTPAPATVTRKDGHAERENAEMRARCNMQLEALMAWHGFRAVSDALLAEAEARNAQLESQLAGLAGSLRKAEGERIAGAADDETEVLRAEVTSLKSEIVALLADLSAARERQQRAQQPPVAEALRAAEAPHPVEEVDPGNSANVVMIGDQWYSDEPPAPRRKSRQARRQTMQMESPRRSLVRLDPDGEHTYAIGRRTTIGRTPDNDIQVDAHNVSRHHAVLLTRSDQCLVEDLNSTNGVLVNGQRIVRQALRDGDTVTIGKTEFRFVQRP
jgi:hypothetical protein